MKRTLLLGTAVTLLAAYGVAEGLWTDRWGLTDGLERAVARLDRVPRSVGDWEGKDQELDPRQVARAEISGYVMRRYTHRASGAAVTVLLVCGRPGPTALHSPDVCYAGAGYAPLGEPARQAVKADGLPAEASLWVGQYRKPGPSPEPLRIYWAWGAAGHWLAAANPRWELSRHAALYKLYVIRELPRADEPRAEDPALDFLGTFLPEAQRALFAAPEPAAARR